MMNPFLYVSLEASLPLAGSPNSVFLARRR